MIGLPYHQPYAPVLDLAGTPGMRGAYLWTCRQTLHYDPELDQVC